MVLYNWSHNSVPICNINFHFCSLLLAIAQISFAAIHVHGTCITVNFFSTRDWTVWVFVAISLQMYTLVYKESLFALPRKCFMTFGTFKFLASHFQEFKQIFVHLISNIFQNMPQQSLNVGHKSFLTPSPMVKQLTILHFLLVRLPRMACISTIASDKLHKLCKLTATTRYKLR
ncbi:hypothetical protein I3842_15G103200 [Carya illinoinensis]|uniref:Uncharacterized protein n=1 Tax=Carya illinoinensis TaxID=32201 RepID=A0A922DB47_CARIL|nr:hypothetical protein I3842_15G103200 [Carya illinoinensis]